MAFKIGICISSVRKGYGRVVVRSFAKEVVYDIIGVAHAKGVATSP